MEFIAGLIIGVLLGMFSWLALAAWLETQRAWAGSRNDFGGPAATGELDRLHEQPSHG
ncbi:MAG: hypothetical protein ACLQBA_02140 [Candidatus Binataceae bacterium]